MLLLLRLLVLIAVAVPASAYAVPTAAAKPGGTLAPEKTVWGRLVAANGVGIELSKPVVLVGSGAGADAVLVDRTVSPLHARLTYKDGRAFLEDLGSKYGTLVSGSAVKKGDTPRLVTQKADLAFGAVSYTFEFGVRPALIPPLQALPKGKGKAKSAPANATPAKTAPAKTVPAKENKPK